LTRYADGFIAFNASGPIRPRVDGVSGAQSTTKVGVPEQVEQRLRGRRALGALDRTSRVVDRVDRHPERSHQPHQLLADTAGADDEDARAEQAHPVDGRPVGRLAEHVQAACEGEHQRERVLGAGGGVGATGARVRHAVAQDTRREPALDAGGRELDPVDAGVVELA